MPTVKFAEDPVASEPEEAVDTAGDSCETDATEGVQSDSVTSETNNHDDDDDGEDGEDDKRKEHSDDDGGGSGHEIPLSDHDSNSSGSSSSSSSLSYSFQQSSFADLQQSTNDDYEIPIPQHSDRTLVRGSVDPIRRRNPEQGRRRRQKRQRQLSPRRRGGRIPTSGSDNADNTDNTGSGGGGGGVFSDLSNSLYNSVIIPLSASLRDERRTTRSIAASSISSVPSNDNMLDHRDDMDATWWEHAPYLDDTMVTYDAQSPSGRNRKWCGAIVNHPITQSCILAMITLNALLMGIMTFDFVLDNPEVMRHLIIVDWVFLGLFAVEILLQLIWHGKATLADPWLMFDIGILCCSWVPELRILRFARVINRLEMLQTLTRAIGLVMPRMFSIALLLLIVIYTYSVLFTELFRDVQFEEGTNYFESLPASMFTCFEMMTMEWAHIARDKNLQANTGSWIPITTFVTICGVIFVNLVMAVICDAVAVLGVDVTGRNEEERRKLQDLQEKIADTQKRVQKLLDAYPQLVKNQKNTLELLKVQLAKQINHQEKFSRLLPGNLPNESTKHTRHGRHDLLAQLTQDHKFEEHDLVTKLRIVSGVILESDLFEFFIFTIICTDCVLMGLATFDFVNESEKLSFTLDTTSFVFLLVYTAEAVMGFIYLGWGVFKDAWMAFDIFIVVTSWIADLLQGLKTFREFRAVRVVRAFRLLSALYTLRDLCSAIGTAIPRVSRVMPLLLLIFYIFAVLFVELFRDVEFEDGFNYFGRLDYALFTCLQMMTMEWANLAREALDKTGLWWANFLFVLFVIVSGMLFFDLIKATVCDAVAVINGRSRRLSDIRKCRHRLKRISRALDNLSLKTFHTINFQNHINRMMMKDLEDLASTRRGKAPDSDSEEELGKWKKLQQTLDDTLKARQKEKEEAAKKNAEKESAETKKKKMRRTSSTATIDFTRRARR